MVPGLAGVGGRLMSTTTVVSVTALLLLSGLLELVGLICAGVGFRDTWHEHAHGEKFIEPMLRPVRSWARAVSNRISRLFNRPDGGPRVAEVGMGGSITPTGTLGLKHIWGPPPDPATDLGAYAEVVTKRINELHEIVQNVRHDLATETEARKTNIRRAQAALGNEIDEVRRLSRRVAVEGLRLQVIGWLFLIMGIFVGTIANVIGR